MCVTLFKEIYRVLVPGGKVMLNCHVKAAFGKLIVRSGGDKVLLEKDIEENLSKQILRATHQKMKLIMRFKTSLT